jgi:hypothetical protein
MSLEAHARELAHRHEFIDKKIKKLSSLPATKSSELLTLKRQKLHIKDELERVRSLFAEQATH